MDPKLVLFQSIFKMIGVPPEAAMQAVQTVIDAGDRLSQIERKLDVLLGALPPDSIVRPSDHCPTADRIAAGTGRGNGADHGGGGGLPLE